MDKKAKIHLTNEDLRNKFKSSFDLVTYAIRLAENMIKTGRDARVKSDVQNRAMLILEEIHQGKDQFDEIQTTTPTSENFEGTYRHRMNSDEQPHATRKYRTSET
jgi:DNA-directed RNA polymerase omega subunit